MFIFVNYGQWINKCPLLCFDFYQLEFKTYLFQTCRRLINLEGLDVIIYACRSSDSLVLRNCASALANLAMYGNSETQRQMAARKAMDWLFPLAFSGDDTVAYYALIAIAALAANVDLEKAAIR